MQILVIDAFPEKMIRELREIPGAEVVFQPAWTQAEIFAHCASTEVIIMNSKIRGDAALLEHAPRLKMVCRAGVGLDHIDVPLLESKGVKVFSTPGANADTVAEQTIGMMLALLHRIVPANQQVKQYQWKREANRGTELMGKTVGIIGYGNCGSRVGERLRSFGCNILAYDKYKSKYAPEGVTETSLQHLLEEADILTFHVPLTAETHAMANTAFYNSLRKPIYLLNLARGPIVPLADLAAALDQGQVKAAALDVLENEDFARLSPEEKSRLDNLFARDNVIFTPHIGGWSFESLERINSRIVESVRELARS